MAKKVNNSRLNETDFSQYNLRDSYITSQVEYISALRDEAIFSNWGIKVLIKIPCDDFGDLNDNNVDEYSNFVNTTWLDTTETVVPKFSEYRQLLSEAGMTADGIDGIYPLEVLIPSKLYIPRNSRLIFTEYDANDNQVQREWVVLGTIQKQLSGSKTYTRILNCVPARQNFFTTSTPSVGHIYFNTQNIQRIFIKNDIRAQGQIWFDRDIIKGFGLQKVYNDSILEDLEIVEENPTYQEDTIIPYFYDDRAVNIAFGGKNFSIGDLLPVFDENNNKVQVLINPETNEYKDLMVFVKNVDSTGSVIDFAYNINKGYSDLSNLLLKTDIDNANALFINMNCITYIEDNIEETIEPAAIEKPKYFTAYTSETVFKSKKIAVSVYI